jgi:hypothetical protein
LQTRSIGIAWRTLFEDRQLLSLASSLVVCEVLVSIATWYGISVLGGHELNAVFGYTTLIEVGRPIFALTFALLLVTAVKTRFLRRMTVGLLLTVSVGDFTYDVSYMMMRAEYPAIAVGLVAVASVLICLLTIKREP